MNKRNVVILASLGITLVTSYFLFYRTVVIDSPDLSDPHVKFVVNIEEDINLLMKSAEQGDITAISMLGHNYLFGIKVDKNIGSAIKWLTKAAEKNDSRAQELLGSIYLSEDSIKDYSKAMFWYEKSASQNNEAAQLSLAKIYANGWGVAKDMKTASIWLEKANTKFQPPLKLEQLLEK